MTTALRSYGRRVLNLTRRVANRVLGPSASGAMLAGLAELRGELASMRGEVAHTQEIVRSLRVMRGEVADTQEMVRSLRNELAGQISFLAHDLGSMAEARAVTAGAVMPAADAHPLQDRLAALESALLKRLGEIHQNAFEARNLAAHVDSSVHSRLNELLHAQLPGVLEQVHQVAALLIDEDRPWSEAVLAPGSAPNRHPACAFEQAIKRARADHPTVFESWKQRLDEMSAAFASTKQGNAAHGADPYSRLFRQFVRKHAVGNLLDIGCGPFGLPFYLDGFPERRFAGLEPLPTDAAGSAKVVRGISEYLPWDAASFDTVISATSLDHCLSLERSLNEIERVLRPGGILLLWIGSIPGSPPYRPLDPGFEPADRFHLFHFDIAWFEPLLAQRFETVDRVKLDRAGYSHVFYCLRPLRTAGDPND
jgi:SAM-dependent methyltransferase